MYRHIITLLLTAFISACGGGGDENSDVITVSKPPKATNVALKGSGNDNGIQSGQEVIGQYTFNSASIPPGLDASIGFWETESGTSIHRGLKYRIPYDNSLAGTQIRFCVKPFNRIDRKAGKKACSKFVLITPVFFDPSTPMVKILSNAYTPEVVGGELLTFIIDKNGDIVDDEHGFRWKRNGQIIPNENSGSYLLTVADEGKYISVCIINQVTNTLISCSEETNMIQGAAGSEPVAIINPLLDQIELGKSAFLDYEFLDFDNDKEDLDSTSFSWFLDGQPVAKTQSLYIETSMVNKQLKGCVTPYSLTGWPKAGDVTCTEAVTVQPLPNDTPHALNVVISGHRFEGETLIGTYRYFESNNNPEAQSEYSWTIVSNDQEKQVSNEQSYRLQDGDLGKGNKVRFCVTPINSHARGYASCRTEDIAWLDGEGNFKEGGEVTANLKGFPEFSQSYWLSSDEDTALPLAINTRSNSVSPLAIESPLSNFINLRPMRLCISFDNNLLNSDDVCREIPVGNKLTRYIRLKDEQGVHAAININQSVVVDKHYRLHRPHTWSEFKALPKNMQSEFSSAESSHLIGESYSGVKMTPQQANKFCLLMHGATGLASPVFYNKFATGSDLSNSWPTELMLQEFVAKGPDGYYQLDNSGFTPPVPADLRKKYAFMCVSLAP